MRHHDVSTWIRTTLTTGRDDPQCNTGCQDPVQTVDKQQDPGELIAPLLPRQNKASTWLADTSKHQLLTTTCSAWRRAMDFMKADVDQSS
ncbi:hypothetical protein ACRRTK_000677 [Alexandromys fortis]